MAAARESGATLFLAPRGNCDVVRTSTPDGLQVAAVDNVTQALDALAAYRDHKPVVGCDTPA